MTVPWHANAVIYQLYVPSFQDFNRDGTGDIRGAIEKLSYIRDLGATAIWLSPCYPSPMRDGGYDVSDYRGVRDDCGTMADMDELIKSCHDLGLRIILDIVPNHTSDQHPWFQAAVREIVSGSLDTAARDRYLFLRGDGSSETPPNNWRSLFGGSAWTEIDGPPGKPGFWYLHMFAPEQPDLNWTNPAVRAEFLDIIRFWFARGVDGFRIDVAHGLFKDLAFPDVDPDSAAAKMLEATKDSPYWGRKEVFAVWEEWRRVADEYPGRMLVGEAWAPDRTSLTQYIGDERLHQVFNFDGFLHLFHVRGWEEPATIKLAITDWLEATSKTGTPATWVLENHDVPRLVTRLGGGPIGQRRARAAALLLLALPGAVYLYQGQELGLPEVDVPDDARRDPVFLRSRGTHLEAVGRDGCRVPLGWSGSSAPYGFSPSPSAEKPWLPQPTYWGDYTVEKEAADPDSILNLYKRALKLRHSLEDSGFDGFEWLETKNVGVLAFRRGRYFTCVVNTLESPTEVRVEDGDEVTAASSPEASIGNSVLRISGNTAVWLTSAQVR